MKRMYALTIVALVIAGAASAQEAPITLDQAFEALRTYELGKDSKPLEFLVDQTMTSYGNVDARRDLANRIAAILGSEATFDAKLFACRQLYVIGTEEQLPALAPLLLDEKLSDVARYALENMPGDAVDKAFLDALGKTSGKTKIGIINSLRMRHCEAAVQPLAACLRETDLEVAKAAALALGAIGTRDAAHELMLVMIEVVEGLHKTVVDAYLAVAWAELERGEIDSAREMFRAVHHAPELKAQLMAAMEGWMAADPESTSRQFLIMLTEEDFQWVQQGARYVRTVPGDWVTKLCLAILEQEPPGPARYALIIRALVDRGDRQALPAVTKALDHNKEVVRLAALDGLAKFGGASTVPVLAEAAATREGEEKRVARRSLVTLTGDGIDDALLAELPRVEKPVQVELVRALGERGAAEAIPALLELAARPDAELQEAALKAIAGAAGPDTLPQAVDLIVKLNDPSLREAAQRTAIVLALKRVEPEGRATPVLDALSIANDAAIRCALLETLGGIGDPNALDALRAASADADEAVQLAAVAALSEWPEPVPLDDLAGLAETAASERVRAEALEGYVNMLRIESKRSSTENVRRYEKAMSLATNAALKRRILAGLSEIPSAKALEVVEPLLGDAEIGAEAAVAAEKIRSFSYKASTSSNQDLAKQAIDKNIDTRWTSGARMAGGEWFLLDMDRPAEISGVVLDTSRSLRDYPRGYEVYAFTDEANPGAPVAKGEGQGPVLEITFAPVTARYLKIVQTGAADGDWWWSIDELRVLVK